MKRVARYIKENYSGKIVEVGIGEYKRVALALDSEPDIKVTVTDIREIETELDFVRDDITEPDLEIYSDVSLIYSVRPPYEIHGALEETARTFGSDLLIVPLSGEETSLDYELVNYEGKVMYRVKFL